MINFLKRITLTISERTGVTLKIIVKWVIILPIQQWLLEANVLLTHWYQEGWSFRTCSLPINISWFSYKKKWIFYFHRVSLHNLLCVWDSPSSHIVQSTENNISYKCYFKCWFANLCYKNLKVFSFSTQSRECCRILYMRT